MTGWWVALGVILLLLLLMLLLPVGICFRFDAAGFRVALIVGFLRLTVFPNKILKKIDWQKLLTKKAKSAEEAPAEQPQAQPQPEMPTQPDAPQTEPTQSPKPAATTQDQLKELLQGGLVREFVPIVRLMLELLDDFRWKLRVKRIELQVVLACDDPCDLAVLYGQAWSAVGNLFPVLERSMVIKKRNIEILCDFMADKTRVKARLDLTITIGRLLLLGGKHGFRFLLKFIDIYKSIKGGAKNEPNSSQYA